MLCRNTMMGCGLPHFVEEMADGGDWVDVEHPGADVSHDLADPGTLFGTVTVNRAFPATGFRVSLRASVDPGNGIIQQVLTFGTQFSLSRIMMTATIYLNHLRQRFLFMLCPRHIIQYVWAIPSRSL